MEQSRFATWGFRLALVALVVLVIGIIANRYGLASFRIALPTLALAALIGLVAAVVSLVGLIASLGSGKTGTTVAVLGIVIGLVAATPVATSFAKGRHVPRIHDITTDLVNPPQFVAVVPLRKDSPNPLDRKEPANLAALQSAAYPDLQTLTVQEQPGKVFEAARDVAHDMGWEIVAATPETGLIEATATTSLLHFKDDIAIRVAERDGGSAVDVRSVSRVGVSDLGVNAKRVRTYLAALKARLAAAPAAQ
jgi:uncharacterized protein (DUF1499 family)